MKRDNETLRAVGEALYGPLWQSELARELGVAIRTMQRWAAGDFEIPAGIWSELAVLCEKRAVKIAALALKLNKLN